MKNNYSKKLLKEIIAQVPPDYYHRGTKTNLLQKYWHSKKWDNLGNTLQGIGNSRLLDIGCADGTTTNQISKRFKEMDIVGIDFYKEAINFAKKSKPHIKFIHGDVHKLPFNKNAFDIVTAIETLEHLENPKLCLSEIRRVLRPKGNLIIIQDTDSLLFRSVWSLWSIWKGSVWKGSHINCLKPKQLISLVKRMGFKIQTVEFNNLYMEVTIRAIKT